MLFTNPSRHTLMKQWNTSHNPSSAHRGAASSNGRLTWAASLSHIDQWRRGPQNNRPIRVLECAWRLRPRCFQPIRGRPEQEGPAPANQSARMSREASPTSADMQMICKVVQLSQFLSTQRSVVWCKAYFDILKRLRVTHECDGQTDGRTLL